MSLQAVDTHRRVTILGAAGLMVAGVLALVGLPRVDLHGPLHHLGIMDPLCGGTRAAYLFAHGDWGGAWTYNPIVFPLAAAAVMMLVRTAVGMVSGRWLAIRVPRSRVLIAMIVIALVALEIRQQLHADLLTSGWTGLRPAL